jgi:hypothetical protein
MVNLPDDLIRRSGALGWEAALFLTAIGHLAAAAGVA